MTFQHLLLIVFYLLLRKHNLHCAEHQSRVGNIAELYNFSSEITNKSLNSSTYALNKSEVRNVADLYNFELSNGSYNDVNRTNTQLQKQTTAGNIADLYDFPSIVGESKTKNVKINQSKQSLMNNLADSYTFEAANNAYSRPNKEKTLPKNLLHIDNDQSNASTVGSIAELYFFPVATVMGMFNCSYENTINITNYPALANGSYIYDNHTVIPTDLVGNYDYEILYNGSKRSVPQHKRACICRLKHCVTLCSHSIIEFYQDVVNDDEVDDDFMNLFSIKVTLANKTVVTKNIVQDFEHIVLAEFCVPFYTLSPERDDKLSWTLFENGTLLRHSDQVQLKNMEYCFELYQDEIENSTYYLINPLNCAKKRDVLRLIEEFNYWTQLFSIPFFLLTIIAYCCLPELRNVHGKCFMTYLSSLTISYGLLSYINLSRSTFDPMPCLLMGYLNHYMQLSHYTWLGIICIDTWKSFNDYAYKASYHQYAMYGYHLPLLITFLTFVAQNSKIDEDLKPGISEYRCGLEVNKWAASIYLYGPCLIILICCLVSFLLTYGIIKTNDREVYKVNEMQFECPRVRYTLYLRLFLMMGLSWFLDVISYLLNMFHMRNISGIIDYINALQGLYIFVNFIGRRRVRNIIREKFPKEASFKQFK